MFPTPPKEAHNMAAHTNPDQLPRRFIKLTKVKDYTRDGLK